MPGGADSYTDVLREICEQVAHNQYSSSDLATWIQDNFGLSEVSARSREGFLHRAGILESPSGQLALSKPAGRWFVTKDDGILIALLHSRLQYFGEMLAELSSEPRSIKELRLNAQSYGLHWNKVDQVRRRRRWLQAASMIEAAGNHRFSITDAGRDLLSKLMLHRPSFDPLLSQPSATPSPQAIAPRVSTLDAPLSDIPRSDETASAGDPSPAEVLADEIRDASTDSKNPDRLEIAVRDAFQFLGFDAEKLGGSGQTDVLVRAPLGRDDSYSVTIDAKTVGAGSLGDGQVDWVTLDDHRKQHGADHSMLVGPNPSGKRLMDRAVAQIVAVLSTEQLADLCLQHADAPLGLESYRALFDTGGAVDMAPISRAAQDLIRLRELAAELLATLVDQTSETGPLTARDLWLLLRNHPSAKTSSQQEIQQVLDTLASPLVGAIQGTADKGYVLATAPRVIQQRLQQLGDLLAAHKGC